MWSCAYSIPSQYVYNHILNLNYFLISFLAGADIYIANSVFRVESAYLLHHTFLNVVYLMLSNARC